MSYNKKDEDDGTIVKVDRTSVFQEGLHKAPQIYASIEIPNDYGQLEYSMFRPFLLEDVAFF